MAEDDFEKNFLAIMEGAEKGLKEKGMSEAVQMLMRDSVMEVNKVPLDEGTLAASASCFVGTRFVKDSDEYAEKGKNAAPTPATSYSPQIRVNEIVGTVGFNTPYAARLHEHPEFEFNGEGRGAKYVESKLSAKNRDYMEVLLDAVVEGMEGAAR